MDPLFQFFVSTLDTENEIIKIKEKKVASFKGNKLNYFSEKCALSSISRKPKVLF